MYSQLTSFKNDIIDLFSHKKGGHVQKWLYNDHIRPDNNSGSKLWHGFVTSNKNYYPIQNEIDIIPLLLKTIRQDYDTVIDFGIGNKRAVNNKIIPILTSQHSLKRYVAIDISEHSLNNGLAIIESQFDTLEKLAIQGDFYKEQSVEGNNRLGVFFGSTISNQEMMVEQNFPRQKIIKRLSTLGNTVKGNKKGSLILGYDANNNLDHALEAYQHPTWTLMMTGLMYDVHDILHPQGGFNPTLWHYAPIIDNKNYVIHQIITPTVDQTFSIDDIDFTLKKSEQFVVMNNFKYPPELIMDMLTEAGLSPYKKPTSAYNNPMQFITAEIK